MLFNHSKLFLENVYLENNDLVDLWYSIDGNWVSVFQGLRGLKLLDVKKNPLRYLKAGLFTDLQNLQILDLSYCELSYLESKAFEGLQRLKNLHLQGNSLHELPSRLFENTGELAMIHLEENILRYLDRDLFVNSSNLRNLTLQGNRLSGFNRSTFAPLFDHLYSIDISKNEVVCTCDIKWLPVWLSGSIIVLNENDTRCSPASLEELKEKPLMSFKPAESCVQDIGLYCSLPIVTIWIFMVLAFAYHYRWFLKYKLFLMKLAVIGYRQIQDARDFDQYEFHLNVMFAEEDEAWVRDRLRPVLEEMLPDHNRNIFGDNGLPIGMHYNEAVDYAVENSYKTIILVSRAAIQDNWFVIKFRIAADQVNDSQLENVVVIFLEGIPGDELPFLVRLYLSVRQPYLGWEEDERFQEYFWQTLIKMLTINLRSNNAIPSE
nr:toll-like receptor 3 [Lytechinus pictus]